MSTVWEYTDGCAKQYMFALAVYLMTVLSYSYGTIMDREINSPGHGKNVVDGLNATGKRYLKEQMELIGKSESKDASKIIILLSASKDVSITATYHPRVRTFLYPLSHSNWRTRYLQRTR